MKKTWRYLLILCIGILFAGCTQQSHEKQEPPKKEEAKMIIGVAKNNAPYYSTDIAGNPEGLYVELMNALSERGNFAFEFLDVSPVQAKEMITQGKCDAFLGVCELELDEREELLQRGAFYSSPLYLVTPKAGGLKDADELRDRKIAATALSSAEEYARKTAIRHGGDAVTFQDEETALLDMEGGYSQAMAIDGNRLSVLIQNGKKLRVLKKSEKILEKHRITVLSDSESAGILWNSLKEIKKDKTLDELVLAMQETVE